MKNKKALLIYPPTGSFQRGEDRSQGEIETSTATTQRVPLDMIQIAGVLKKINIQTKFVDFPMEKKNWKNYEEEIKNFQPDYLIISTTNTTILKDLKAADIAKKINKKITTIMKGAIFFHLPLNVLKKEEFNNLDIALRIEADTLIEETLENLKNLEKVKSIYYRKNKKWYLTEMKGFFEDLDKLPFPDRSIIKNEFYVRPDTGEPMTTIQISRGCPFNCIYCLTPQISGRRVRYRSAENIVDEIEECVKKYKIKNFFLRADTFTVNKEEVIKICKLIVKRKLNVSWVANSRSDTIEEEMLRWMKKAGCYLIALGFEVGDNSAKKKINKMTTIEQDLRARNLCKKYRLQVYGFFMMGFPWETEKEIKNTRDFIFKLNCEFIEIHLAIPYMGTKLYNIAIKENLISKEEEVIGKAYFSEPAIGTKHINLDKIKKIRKKILKKYYLRPSYFLIIVRHINSLEKFRNYFRYGLRFLKNT